MPRQARFKIINDEGWYHLYCRTSGRKDEMPLNNDKAKRKLVDMIKHYAGGYCCEVAAYCIMGNHYHIVMRFEEPRALDEEELMERALHFYPGKESAKIIANWSEVKWGQFESRIFDVSEFMRNLNTQYSKWYNKEFERKGRFWAERFKNTILEGEQAVQDAMLYVDLNPIRAGLVERPEDYKACSFYLRNIKRDKWLMPLSKAMDNEDGKEAYKDYRYRLYHRGAIPTKTKAKAIPDYILADEESRGYKARGVYKHRITNFTDGLILGSHELIKDKLEDLRDSGYYKRRVNPIFLRNTADPGGINIASLR